MIAADPVREFAPAKINLFLHVGQKRADGYHALQSLVVFAKTGDALTFAPGKGLSLTLGGRFGETLSADPDNLVLKAARLLAAETGYRGGAEIALTKTLPIASGIGGGSSDAAAALRGLNRLWGLGLAAGDLRRLAEQIGSDVPVCVEPGPSFMEGRGEILTPLTGMADAAMVLVNPLVAVPTGKVFAALEKRSGVALSLPPACATTDKLVAYLKTTANDLEAPALAIAPVIGEVLDSLATAPGALFARMSGSGATCFALFEDDASAQAAAGNISARRPVWWVAHSI